MSADALDDLVADRDIRAVLVRYCRGIDRMDALLTRSCWHTDGTADYGRLFKGTADGFIEWLWPVHAAMIGHVHSLSNVTVEIDGDAAATESYVHVVLRVPAPDDGQVDIVGRGRYLDAFERRDGAWAIVHRTYVSDLASTQRVELLDVGGTAPAGTAGSGRQRRRTGPVRSLVRPLPGVESMSDDDHGQDGRVTPSWTRSIPSSSPIPSRPTTSSKHDGGAAYVDRGKGFWLITRHDLVRDVVGDVKQFSSESGSLGATRLSPELLARLREMAPNGRPGDTPTLLTLDPPGHTRNRRLISRAFTPASVKQYEDVTRDICRSLISRWQ